MLHTEISFSIFIMQFSPPAYLVYGADYCFDAFSFLSLATWRANAAGKSTYCRETEADDRKLN